MAIKVKLRQKPISGGRHTLYLDFYPAIIDPETGKETRREFLKMYIYDKPATEQEKLDNANNLEIANGIRRNRENELSKPEVYTEFERERMKARKAGEKDFIEYFKVMADKRKTSNHDNWVAVLRRLETFTGGSRKFADLNEKFLSDFREYLLTDRQINSDKTALSQNTASAYFKKIAAALRQAYKEGYLQTDLSVRIESIKRVETHRNYLTLEELNALAQTECSDPLLKRAALFSALTGLRFSDIRNLTWAEVEFRKGSGCFLKFTQQKTGGVEDMPISDQAASFMGEPRERTTKVFEGLQYSVYYSKRLAHWIGNAGITKDITFHCFRHTFATLQLEFGTDIYTVSKMLGHRDLKTTQIYAKIVDQRKREAANRIKLDI